jgi:hypothetical protein
MKSRTCSAHEAASQSSLLGRIGGNLGHKSPSGQRVSSMLRGRSKEIEVLNESPVVLPQGRVGW